MNTRQTYDLSKVDAAAFNHIADVVRFSHERSVNVVSVPSERTLTIEASDPGAFEYIDTFIREMQRTENKLRRKVLWETNAEELYRGDVDQELLNSGDVYVLGDGLVGIRGDVLKVFKFFEEEFVALARLYEADENHYPVMIPIELLEELDYFSHFPQQVTFCSHFPEDLPFFEELVRDLQTRRGCLSDEYRRRIAAAAHVLKPAVCLPCYAQNRGRVIQNGGGFAMSMQNHVFRYEGGNFRSLSRLWDFTVRDIVFFGGYEALVHRRLDVVQRSVSLCRELGLESRVQLANDPFFLDSTRNKRIYQRLGEVKYELVLSLPGRDEELAVSSFNLHRDFYSKVYDIRFENGDCIESACMGFGIDRWVYGFLAQNGLDQRRWPERVRAYVAGAPPHS